MGIDHWADDFKGGATGAGFGAGVGAGAGPIGSLIGGMIGFMVGFAATEAYDDALDDIGSTGPDYNDRKPGPPTTHGPGPNPGGGATPAPDGRMDEYSGFAKPVRGLIGIRTRLGHGLPLHFDTVLKRAVTRAILRDMANKRSLEEIDTAYGRKRPRDMRPSKRRRLNPEALRSVRRRLDLDGITNFAEEARRVWEDVQMYLPRH